MTKPADSKQAIPSPEDRVRAMKAEELLNVIQNSGGCALSAYQPLVKDARNELISRLSLVEELKGQVAAYKKADELNREETTRWQAEAALLRKRKDYHAEYVEAVEAAEKAKGELERMREALQEIASYEDEIFAKQIALKALTERTARTIIQDHLREKPDDCEWEMVKYIPADGVPQAEPPSTKSFLGLPVYVDNPQFTGYGMAAYDSGDRKRVIGVLLENGNTWEYDAATVREARHEELPKMPRFIRERFKPWSAQPGDAPQKDGAE